LPEIWHCCAFDRVFNASVEHGVFQRLLFDPILACVRSPTYRYFRENG
jgi:hypothetical protein